MNPLLASSLINKQNEAAHSYLQISRLREIEPFVDLFPFQIDSISSGWGNNPPQVWTSTTTRAFLSEDAPELLAQLEELDSLANWETVRSIDMPEGSKRLYCFESPLVEVCLTVFLVEDGLCRRKVIGTQKAEKAVIVTMDEPVYAFDC